MGKHAMRRIVARVQMHSNHRLLLILPNHFKPLQLCCMADLSKDRAHLLIAMSKYLSVLSSEWWSLCFCFTKQETKEEGMRWHESKLHESDCALWL